MRRRRGTGVVVCLLAGMAATVVTGSTAGAAVAANPASAGLRTAASVPPPSAARDAVPDEQRASVLGSGWRTSQDVAWSLAGDATGLHVLAAPASSGYSWRTVATLVEPGFDTDRWIGNACATASGKRLVVTYAPRAFTNREALFDRGGFVAVVTLATGSVKKLAATSSLAWFSPGCGAGERAVVSQFASDTPGAAPAAIAGRTRLVELDAAAAKVSRTVTVPGELTSAVPVRDGGLAGADSGAVVSVAADGSRRVLAAATGVPFELHPDAAGGLVFMDHQDGRGAVKRADLTRSAGGLAPTTTLATAPVSQLGLAAAASGAVSVLGSPDWVSKALPASVRVSPVAVGATSSTRGELLVTPVVDTPLAEGATRVVAAEPDVAAPVRLRGTAARSGRAVEFGVSGVAASVAGDATAVSPALAAPASAPAKGAAATGKRRVTPAATGSPSSPIESERTCSVPRNDPRNQAMQPKPRQVEWAVDQAITGSLTVSRPANWKNLGMSAYTPQGLFPPRTLVGGGRVPAQVMLGVLAQESNLWQAARFAVPGVTANPLIGNFYGIDYYNDTSVDDWDIDWSKSDCGYGVGQVTDGMRLSGTEPTLQQRAIALDFAANIARGLQILQDKWNETRSAGIVINNGDPAKIENWFAAIWAYNTGFHAKTTTGPWGLGWLNNPANPKYPANRAPFLDVSYADAAKPQNWPYPEKVMGWAGHPLEGLESPGTYVSGYRAAWWNGDVSTGPINRATVKPPVNLFCNASNTCEPGKLYTPNDPEVIGEKAGPCAHKNAAGLYDLQCWYNQPATWKSDCSYSCGNELLRFSPGYAYQDDATSYPPNCSLTGLPSGALVIDDVATSVPSVRPGCTTRASNGTFSLSFGADSTGRYPSKVDFHQIGAGFGGHFSFAHTRKSDAPRLRVTGTWTLDRSITGWARVLVHMPDHGAHTQQASYTINLGNGKKKTRVVLQRTMSNRWVNLGVAQFAGTPSVSLSNVTKDGDGSEDVAWDAVAFQPLTAKPKTVMVSLGDSYSSGEGASETDGRDYYPETNNHGYDTENGKEDPLRNSCHRSPFAWSRQGVLAGNSATIGSRADSWDPTLDYTMLACSGAQTENILPRYTIPSGTNAATNAFGEAPVGQYRELSQLDRGFLDGDTTLVTISIGGNDSRFSPIVQKCVLLLTDVCQDATLDGDSAKLSVAEPDLIATKVEDSLVIVLQEIRKKAPNAKVMLMGYPKLLERSGFCVPGIGTAEAPWLNEVADVLAQHMDEAVQRVGGATSKFWFSDPRNDFRPKGLDVDGYAVCGEDERVHGIVTTMTEGDTPLKTILWPGKDPKLGTSQQSFHPKKSGQLLYANSMNDTLRGMGL
ncbi:MAG: GDSL-type esterase/lipase family protein [Kineosporiaceae bacterium]